LLLLFYDVVCQVQMTPEEKRQARMQRFTSGGNEQVAPTQHQQQAPSSNKRSLSTLTGQEEGSAEGFDDHDQQCQQLNQSLAGGGQQQAQSSGDEHGVSAGASSSAGVITAEASSDGDDMMDNDNGDGENKH
jgi:hypothetical protein